MAQCTCSKPKGWSKPERLGDGKQRTLKLSASCPKHGHHARANARTQRNTLIRRRRRRPYTRRAIDLSRAAAPAGLS